MEEINNLNEKINNFKSKRIYLEDEDQNDINNYVQCKKIKIENDNDKEACYSLNLKQKNLLPPSPPLDYMHCQTYYDNEEFENFSLDNYEIKDSSTSITNVQKINNNNVPQDNVLKFNVNIQHRKKYIPKFTIGYRSDCKKCRDGVPNHYGHINYEL